MQLAELLHLEKSSVSRMVRKLIENGELSEIPDAEDARFKLLSLTTKGKRTLARINEYGQRQVAEQDGRQPDQQRIEGKEHHAAEGISRLVPVAGAGDLQIEAAIPARPDVQRRIGRMHMPRPGSDFVQKEDAASITGQEDGGASNDENR